jgi:hypothetical protein
MRCVIRGATMHPERRLLHQRRGRMDVQACVRDRGLIPRLRTLMEGRRTRCRRLQGWTRGIRGRGYGGCCLHRTPRAGSGDCLMAGSRKMEMRVRGRARVRRRLVRGRCLFTRCVCVVFLAWSGWLNGFPDPAKRLTCWRCIALRCLAR